MKRAEFLNRAAELLRRRRDELRRRVGAGLDELSHREGPVVLDQADAAVEDEFQMFLCSFADLGKNELAEIERALEKIREGTYGVCEACGRNIPVARLEAIPTATLCVRCQQAWEQRRASGRSASEEDDAA